MTQIVEKNYKDMQRVFDPQAFAQRLMLLRKELGLTQKELADRLGVVQKTVSRWEANQGLPSVDDLHRLSIVCDRSVTELMYGTPDTPKSLADEIAKQVVSRLNSLGNNEKSMSLFSSGWNEKQVARARSLMQRSLDKGNHASLIDALAAVGVTGNYAILQRILDRERGTYAVSPDAVRAIALFCYQVVGWNSDNEPTGLTDSTYQGNTEMLMRDLANGSNLTNGSGSNRRA